MEKPISHHEMGFSYVLFLGTESFYQTNAWYNKYTFMNSIRSKGGTYLFVFLFFLSVLLISNSVEAAYIYIDPGEASLYRGDTKTLSVRLDTDEDECINAVDVVLQYDPGIRVIDVSRGNSILNIWVEDPVIDEQNHTVSFVGGIPGGYCGRIPGDPRLTNVLAELVVRSPGFSVGTESNQKASIWINDASQVRIHDQFGTRADLRTTGATITLLPTVAQSPNNDWNQRIEEDTNPPGDFSILLSQDTVAFGGKYYIIFNTQDKQSGVDHYEVIEEPFDEFDLFKWGSADAPWKRVQSPYVLEDQTLNSTIRVRAIDKAGNITMSVLVPDEALRTVSLGLILSILSIIVFVLLVLFGIGYLLWRRKEKIIQEYDEGHDT